MSTQETKDKQSISAPKILLFILVLTLLGAYFYWHFFETDSIKRLIHQLFNNYPIFAISLTFISLGLLISWSLYKFKRGEKFEIIRILIYSSGLIFLLYTLIQHPF